MSRIRKILHIVFILLCSLSPIAHAQDIILFKEQIPIDKLEDLLAKETAAHEETDVIKKTYLFSSLASEVLPLSDDLGVIMFNNAVAAAKITQNDSLIANMVMRSGVPYINRGDYNIAEERLSEAFQYWNQSGDSLELAKCYIFQGYLERLRGRYYLALDNIYKAKSIQAQFMQPYEMWDVANRTMLNYAGLGDYKSAVAAGEEFLQSARPLENKPSGYYTILINTGNFHFQNDNYLKAKEYVEEAIPIWLSKGYPKYLSNSYSLLCDIAQKEENLSLANSYADSSLLYSGKFDSPLLESEAHLVKFQLLQKLGQIRNQEYHITTAYAKAIESNNKETLLSAAEEYARFMSLQFQFKLAYTYQSIADSLRKEIFSEELTSKLDELEKRLLLEKSQNEIELLNEQNELKEQNLKKASRLRKFLLGFLILALGTCALIFLLLRQRSQYNKNLEDKNTIITKSLSEKELLLKEIHHRVKNNLQFISSLLRLQSDHVDDPKALGALQQGHNRVRSMALIHQNLYKEDNLTGVDTKEYFTKLITGLFKSNNIHDTRIGLNLDVSELNLDVDTIVPIGLITNELITNSLKYAFPEDRSGIITVRLYEKDNKLNLSISDNGIGMSSDQKSALGSSFGYKLIQALVGQLQGQYSINNGNGTAVNITLEQYEKT